MQEIFFASTVLGLVAGLLAGLFGIGGGLVIVPVLAMLFTAQHFPVPLVLLMAIATSLATIILTACASVWAHHRLGSVRWRQVFRLVPGIMVGTVLGAIFAQQLPTGYLRIALAVFLVYVGLQMALAGPPNVRKINENRWLDLCAGLVIGTLSALVGIGGGTLTVPYLLQKQQPMANAVAISSACGLPIAVAGSLSYFYLGQHEAHLPEWSAGYIYLPAVLGVGLSSVLTAP